MPKNDSHRPLSPYAREQERLRREAEEKQREQEAREAQIKSERGKEIEAKAGIEGVEDPKTRQAVVDEVARVLAARGAPQNFDWDNHRGVIDDAVDKVQKAEELRLKQEYEKAVRDGENLKIKEALRESQAATPERLQRQFGRYDALRDPPSPLQPPTSQNPNQPLSANEVLQRFGDPALQAQYQKQEDQRQQQAKPSLLTPSEISQAGGRGNAGDAQKGTGLMSDFVKQETKRKTEEERAFDAAKAQVFGRGGHGR
jgi:hypothetical protein